MLGLLFPLLSGLYQMDQQKKSAEAIKGLLGTPEGARAGDEGPVQIPGSGLLADPTNPTAQMQFAAGLMGVPGGRSALQAFQPMLNQAIQSKQWSQTFEQGARQYEQTEARLTDQFQKQYNLSVEEAKAMAQQRIQAQQNWQAQFDQQLAQNRQSQANEGARLALSRQEFAYRQKQDAAKVGGPLADFKPPSGYVPTGIGANGLPTVAPLEGTEPYAKAKGAEGALTNAMTTIDALKDEYLGKETPTRGGQTVRMGGMGSEHWGPGFASMNAKRGSILAAMGTMREMGVLDKSEYDRLTRQLPEVDNWLTGDKTVDAAYSGVRKEFERKLKAHRAANPWLVPALPQGFTVK